jgi:hypothetical protein
MVRVVDRMLPPYWARRGGLFERLSQRGHLSERDAVAVL